MFVRSRSKWNLEVLVFRERGTPDNQEKNLKDKGENQQQIDLVDDSCRLCTGLRIVGIKAMSRGISGGKQVIKFSNTSNYGQVC